MASRLVDIRCSELAAISDRNSNRASSKIERRVFADSARWTVIIPFRNEARLIANTLRCVAAQTVRLQLVLVDNGSTDLSVALATAECARLNLKYQLIREPEVGKVRALAAGLAMVKTPFVATFDADTIYPADYLDVAERLLELDCSAAAQAYYTFPAWKPWRRLIAAIKLTAAARLLPHQCHNGGAGQVFRTHALRASGGFDPDRWNLILEDHEIVHRIRGIGQIRYSRDFWCSPARRERDQPSTRWSLGERLAYHLTPAALQSQFFYGFLGPRLARRSMHFAMQSRRS